MTGGLKTFAENTAKNTAKHLKNWPELYAFPFVSVALVFGCSFLAYSLTSRAPRVNLDWLPELALNFLKINLAILATSVAKQALWSWFTVDEKMKHPFYSTCRMFIETIVLCYFTYLLSSQ